MMNEILNIAIGSVTIGGIVIFLGKKLIDKGFDAALKSFENKLELLKIEHQIKYSKLHEERAVILKELYKELYDLETALANMTSAFQGPEWTDDDIRRDKAKEKLKNCTQLLENNRIFFTLSFCKELEESIEDCEDVFINMEKAKFFRKNQIEDLKFNRPVEFKEGESPLEIWFRQEEKVKTNIKKRRIELADSFRKIIGVEDN